MCFIFSLLALIDLLAVLPFYLLMGLLDLRLVRLLRLLKVIAQVVRRKRAELLVTLGMIGFIITETAKYCWDMRRFAGIIANVNSHNITAAMGK